jgi:hypothetical protein
MVYLNICVDIVKLSIEDHYLEVNKVEQKLLAVYSHVGKQPSYCAYLCMIMMLVLTLAISYNCTILSHYFAILCQCDAKIASSNSCLTVCFRNTEIDILWTSAFLCLLLYSVELLT